MKVCILKFFECFKDSIHFSKSFFTALANPQGIVVFNTPGANSNAVKELVDVAQDDARTIKTDLKNDMYKLQDSMDQIVNDNRELNRSVHSKISDLETSTQYMIGDAGKNLNNLIQHASDRFDAKRTSIEESAQRRQDFLTDEMKNLEDRFDTKLQRALSNPLAGQ